MDDIKPPLSDINDGILYQLISPVLRARNFSPQTPAAFQTYHSTKPRCPRPSIAELIGT
jgi:hypothetical protein